MAKMGKKYQASAELVDKSKLYDSSEALDLVCQTAKAKFDETVEVHIRLGVDSRHADQQVRGAIVLPNGTGKTVRTLVFARGDKAEAALAAGADFVGAEDYVQKIQTENWFEFDVVIASPDMMGVIGRLGKVLGPKGLMPNPKTVLDLTCLSLGNSTCNISGNSACLGVRHKSLRTENTTKTSDNGHHVGRCDNNVELEPVLFLDLVCVLHTACILCTGIKSCLNSIALCEYENTNLLTCSVGENYSTANLLVCVTGVNSETDVELDGLIELCLRGLAYKAKSLCGIIKLALFEKLFTIEIFLTLIHL